VIKNAIFIYTVVVAATLAGAVTVQVSSPSDGATVASPIHLVAQGSASVGIDAVALYVDDQLAGKWNQAAVDTSVNVGNGTHYLVVQAWDKSGAVTKQALQVFVSGTGTSGSGTSSGGSTSGSTSSGSASTVTTNGVTVKVSSPTAGSTATAPLHISAQSSANSGIAAMAVYLDDNLAGKWDSASVDTSVSVGGGNHYLVVQAWDNSGNVGKNTMTVNVNGTSSTSSSTGGISTSTSGGGSATYSSLDEQGGWQSCSACANRVYDGVFDTALFSTSQFRNSPSIDGASEEFWIGGDTPYTNALWWKEVTPQSGATHLVYDTYLYYVNPDAPEALEFDVNQVVGGYRYIFGTQCNYGRGAWDVWDTANHYWVHTGIGCWFSPYEWHHITWEFARSGGQAVFVAVTVDGQKSYLNWSFWPMGEGGSELNLAFQMDGNYRQTDYSVWLDKVSLNVW